MKTIQSKHYLSRVEVAGLFQVSPPTISRWADSGKLSVTKIGSRHYYDADAVKALLPVH